MSDRKNVVKIDLASAAFILGIILLIILFWGDPDLHDGIMHRLMSDGGVASESVGP